MKKSELKQIITKEINDIIEYGNSDLHSIHIPTKYEYIQLFIILGKRSISNVILSVTNDTNGLYHSNLINEARQGDHPFTHPSQFDENKAEAPEESFVSGMSIDEYLDYHDYSVEFDFDEINKDKRYKESDIIDADVTIDTCYHAILSVSEEIGEKIKELTAESSICRIKK